MRKKVIPVKFHIYLPNELFTKLEEKRIGGSRSHFIRTAILNRLQESNENKKSSGLGHPTKRDPISEATRQSQGGIAS